MQFAKASEDESHTGAGNSRKRSVSEAELAEPKHRTASTQRGTSGVRFANCFQIRRIDELCRIKQ